MTADMLAGVPGALKIEGFDGAGNPLVLEIPVCRTLPTAAATALDRDLIAIGRQAMTPYQRLQPQLKAMAGMIRAAVEAGDKETANLVESDRQSMLRKLAEDLQSGRADDLAAGACWEEGRKSVAGLLKEIVTRMKHAGGAVESGTLRELGLIVTEANAGAVLAALQVATGELADPTAAT